MIRKRCADCIQNGCIGVGPVCLAPLSEVVDGKQIIICQNHAGLIVIQRQSADQLFICGIVGAYCAFLCGCHINITPVDRYMVAAAAQRLLCCSAHLCVVICGRVAFFRTSCVAADQLRLLLAYKIRGYDKVHPYVAVFFLFYCVVDIGTGSGNQRQIIQKQRGSKLHIQDDFFVFKGVGGGGRSYVHTGLTDRLVELLVAKKAVNDAIHIDIASQLLANLAPVHRILVIQMIRAGPDRKIRVVCD